MVFEAAHLSVRMGGRTLLEDVSFSLEAGQMLAVVGGSGAGKTTLCRALMGLLPIGATVSGRVCYAEKNLLTLDEADRQRLYGREIALIMQNPMTAFNPSVRLGRQLEKTWCHHHPGEDWHTAAEANCVALLMRLGLEDVPRILRSYPSALSGGMLQRLMIAAALLNAPCLLIADEATTAIDACNRRSLMALLAELCREGMAVLFVTHDLRAAAVADQLLVMARGHVVEQGPTARVMAAPAHAYTRYLLDACHLERRRGR